MPNPIQSYLSRDFDSIRNDLLDFLKVHYPDQYQDFNTVSIGMSLVDLLAYVSDLLSYNTDKKFNELFLDSVTEKTSVYRLAKNNGYKVPGYRPAITLCDFAVTVPQYNNNPDNSYLPTYRPGVQAKGNGQVFETVNQINFASDFSEDGTANRKIEPIFNANQDIIKYRITKREKVKAGQTKVFSTVIDLEKASTPFLEVFLPDDNVLEIISVIVKPGTNFSQNPTYQEFNNFTYQYFEVDELAENKIFTDDSSESTFNNDVTNSIKIGKYTNVNQRFIKDFMADGSCKLTFGGGVPDLNAYEEYLTNLPLGTSGNINVAQIFANSALGEKLPVNNTLFVKYRIGGGTLSNIGANVLNQVANIDAVILGSDQTLNQTVIASTTCNNPIVAQGGADLPTVDEIKYAIASNYAAQKRCVTLPDYISRVMQIPGRYSSIFRVFGKVEDNKIKLYILSKDANGKIMTVNTSQVKQNLISYLTPYRMINDFVEINDGKVINISVEVDVLTDKNYNGNEVKSNILNTLQSFFDINKWQMNDVLYVSSLTTAVKEVAGVINVVDIRIYGMDSGIYSNTLSSQATGIRELISPNTYRTTLELINNAVFSSPISILEVRYPENDIKVRVM